MGLFKRFSDDQRGSIATLAAMTLPILVGAAALGTEASYWMAQKSRLRTASDVAAITAANLYQRRETKANIESVIKSAMQKNGYDISKVTLTVNLPPAAGEPLTVNLAVPGDKYFTKAIWNGNITITARTAITFSAGPVCVLATHPTASGALNMTGNTDVDLGSCLAAANSTSSSAVTMGGSAELVAGCLYAGGGITGTSGRASLDCTTLMENRPAVKGPLDGMTQPPAPSPCNGSLNVKPKDDITVSPGCYSGSLRIQGKIKFNPGIYYFKDADLTINSGASLVGAGVTFIFSGDYAIKNNGHSNLNLTAPVEGSSPPSGQTLHYPGVLFWGASTGGPRDIKINGSASSVLSGVMSFEKDDVELLGSAGMQSDCLRLVGSTVKMSGNSSMTSDCQVPLGGLAMNAGTKLKIVQ